MADEAEATAGTTEATTATDSAAADAQVPAQATTGAPGDANAAQSAEAEPQEQDFGLDAALLARAKDYGVNPALLAEHGEKAAALMDAFAAAVDAKLIASEKGAAQPPQPADKQQPVVQSAEKKPIEKAEAEKPAESQKPPTDAFKYRADMSALKEKYEDDIIQPLEDTMQELNDHRRMFNHILQAIQPLMGMKEHFDRMQGETYLAKVDTLMGSLDEKYGSLVGKGRTEDLAPDSPERKFREQMFDQMDLLANAYLKRGQKLTMQDAMHRALNVLAGDKMEKLARDQVGREVEARKRQTLRNPNRRGSMKPEDKVSNANEAVEALAKLMKETVGDAEAIDAAMTTLR